MDLLHLLADGAWRTGPELATELGISRAAVWKRVRAAREVGAEIQAVQGRGYRLARPFEPLKPAAIRNRLSRAGAAMLDDLTVLPSVDSTSSYLLRDEAGGCRACFAEHQTGGRGRRGRNWTSPFGANLYFSLSCVLDPAPPAIGALSPAVGVNLARALHGLGAAAVRVKWPNDLVTGQGKLGGILLEHRGEAGAGSRVVVGVGLNVDMVENQARTVDQPWVALASLIERQPARNELAAAVLDAVLRTVRLFGERGFAPFREAWPELDALHGRDVWLETGNGRLAARIQGVAADGALMATVGDETRRFYAGELSVRARA